MKGQTDPEDLLRTLIEERKPFRTEVRRCDTKDIRVERGNVGNPIRVVGTLRETPVLKRYKNFHFVTLSMSTHNTQSLHNKYPHDNSSGY